MERNHYPNGRGNLNLGKRDTCNNIYVIILNIYGPLKLGTNYNMENLE
jgi:hypothetical protein